MPCYHMCIKSEQEHGVMAASIKDAVKYLETWKAFEKLYEEGAVRAIGVSNFHIHHLEKLMKIGL
jgi:diketogulonate reductase-like aldo/keto reductase